MQQINYASMNAMNARKPKSKVSAPVAAMGIGAVTLVLMIVGPLYFSEFFQSIETLFILVGVVLFGVFVFLLYWYIYETQIKRDTLLRAFARDNGFTFVSTKAVLGNDYIPAFISSSSLLAPVRRFGYNVTPRSNMSLTGTYAGITFTITIVGMYWRSNKNKAGVSYFGTVTIPSEKFRRLPHVIALSKITSRLSSALNTEVVSGDDWQSDIVGWQSNAYYDIYTQTYSSNSSIEDPAFSQMLADIHEIDQSDVEITDGDLYIIKLDGIDFTESGFEPIFNKIRTVATYLEPYA